MEQKKLKTLFQRTMLRFIELKLQVQISAHQNDLVDNIPNVTSDLLFKHWTILQFGRFHHLYKMALHNDTLLKACLQIAK